MSLLPGSILPREKTWKPPLLSESHHPPTARSNQIRIPLPSPDGYMTTRPGEWSVQAQDTLLSPPAIYSIAASASYPRHQIIRAFAGLARPHQRSAAIPLRPMRKEWETARCVPSVRAVAADGRLARNALLSNFIASLIAIIAAALSHKLSRCRRGALATEVVEAQSCSTGVGIRFPVMFARLLDIGESKLSVLIRYSDVLVEAREIAARWQ